MIEAIAPNKIICLDAEFAQGDGVTEMLELAVTNFVGLALFDSRFKPERIEEWDTSIHHITPEDVAQCPTFADCLTELNAIFEEAEYVMGFAVERNDLLRLKLQGIKGLTKKRILELRDWFWVGYGRRNGLDREDHINLSKCCTELGVVIDDEQWHGAMYDTQLTQECFNRVFETFVSEEFAGQTPSMDAVYARFNERLDEYLAQAAKEKTPGYCAIYSFPDGRHLFKVTVEEPADDARYLVAKIHVESRDAASLHFSKLLTGGLKGRNFYFEKLKRKHLEEFKAYTNEFDADEYALQAKLLRLSARWRK